MSCLIRATDDGLYCEAGNFHIDPWKPVARAVLTHAHSDHARPGCDHYLASKPSQALLSQRLGDRANVQSIGYGESIDIGGVRVSLHPAGHVLGSAQVRLEHAGRVTVVSGDYKVQDDCTCEPFEPVACDCFVSECTFGLPIYRWPQTERVVEEVHAWWQVNAALSRTSVVYAYSLGKAQRLLALLDDSLGPILLHPSVAAMTRCYEDAGARFPAWDSWTAKRTRDAGGAALVIAPPATLRSSWVRKLGEVSTAMASGWMLVRGVRRRRALDRGFVISDHADWRGLLQAIESTGAQQVRLTHGQVEPMCRYLREDGYDAQPLETPWSGESDADAA